MYSIACVTQLPLRGHRDGGVLLDTSQSHPGTSVTDIKDGNYRAILRHIAASSGDALQQYLAACPKNARYTS